MTGVEATKVKVYNSCYHDNALEVFLKAVKDGRAIVTRDVLLEMKIKIVN